MFKFGYRFFYLLAGGSLANLVIYGFSWTRAVVVFLALFWAMSCEHLHERDR